jgi:hypothetical protein
MHIIKSALCTRFDLHRTTGEPDRISATAHYYPYLIDIIDRFIYIRPMKRNLSILAHAERIRGTISRGIR